VIITGVYHTAIKTNDLAATVEFYTKVLGLWEAPRPDFGYPDPSGVQLELTFNGDAEVGPPPDMSPGRRYVAGASFFAPR
jgi:catechol 2,3-dioxygenase-like lactoylglutathione lyase family enzyme